MLFELCFFFFLICFNSLYFGEKQGKLWKPKRVQLQEWKNLTV